jgi:hypothetical protein
MVPIPVTTTLFIFFYFCFEKADVSTDHQTFYFRLKVRIQIDKSSE